MEIHAAPPAWPCAPKKFRHVPNLKTDSSVFKKNDNNLIHEHENIHLASDKQAEVPSLCRVWDRVLKPSNGAV